MNWFKYSWLRYEQKSRGRILGAVSLQTEKIALWQDEFFFKILVLIIPTLIFPFFAGFVMSLIDGIYFLAFVDVLALSTVFYIFFSKNISLKIRKTIFLTTLYVVGLFILIFVGLGGAGMAYLLGVSTFSTLILNRKAGYITLFVNFLMLSLFVVLMTFPFFKESVVFKNSVGSVVAVGVNFLLINILLVYSISSLIKSLQDSQEKEHKYLVKLEKETKAHKRARLRAEESDLLKSSFLSNMSHEICTPVNVILGYVDFLQKSDLSKEDKNLYISAVKENCNRLMNMITDLINLSIIETGQLEIRSSEFSVNEFIREIYRENQSVVENKNLKFSMHVDSDEACVINTDREKFKVVMQKLIDNAIKFTHEGEVMVAYEKKDDELEFYIKDSGIGIPIKQQKDIFKNFRQGETGLSRQFEGNGLGLGIAKAYIEELGGLIGLSSSIEKGSIFYFSFPLKN